MKEVTGSASAREEIEGPKGPRDTSSLDLSANRPILLGDVAGCSMTPIDWQENRMHEAERRAMESRTGRHDRVWRRLRLVAAALVVAVAVSGGAWSTAVAGDGKQKDKPLRGKAGPGDEKKRPPIYAKEILVVELLYKRGKVVQKKLVVKKLKRRRRIRRYSGRFEVRMYSGRKVRERLQFDFPLLGVAATFTKTGKRISRRIEEGLRSRTKVVLPWDEPAERVVVWDRKRKTRRSLDLSVLKRHGMTRRKDSEGSSKGSSTKK